MNDPDLGRFNQFIEDVLQDASKKTREDVNRLMDDVYYGDDSIKKTLAVVQERVKNIQDNMATKTDIANIKWDLLKILLPTFSLFMAILFAILKWT